MWAVYLLNMGQTGINNRGFNITSYIKSFFLSQKRPTAQKYTIFKEKSKSRYAANTKLWHLSLTEVGTGS